MIKVGWARPDSTFRRVFTSMMIPEATEEQMRWLDELQRVVGLGQTAVVRLRAARRGQRRRVLPGSTSRPWCCTRRASR